MLNIKIIKAYIFIGFIITSYSQEKSNLEIYRSYVTDDIPYHKLIINNDEKITIERSVKLLSIVTYSTEFLTKTKNDTIFIISEMVYNKKANSNGKTKKANGFKVKNPLSEQFIKYFKNGKLYKKSDTELIFLNKKQPYFKKKLIDSIIGDERIFIINCKIYKPSISPSISVNETLENPKRAKLKLLKGKKAYKKYGIIGLNGAIEISDKKKRCK